MKSEHPAIRAARAPIAFRMAAVLLLSPLALSCSSGLDRPVKEVTARTESDGVQRVDVRTHTYWFEPNRIVVKSGVPVEIHIHNASWITPHGFTCIAPDAGVETKKTVGFVGRTKTIKFTPKEPGEYPFFCQVFNHSKKGMKGTLVVVQ